MHQTERALWLLPRVASDASPFAIEFSGHEDDKDEVSNPDEDEPSVLLDLRSPELFVCCLTVINFMLLIASTLPQRAINDVNLVGSSKVTMLYSVTFRFLTFPGPFTSLLRPIPPFWPD